MSEKIEFLRSLSLFKDLPERELIELSRICKEYKFEGGAVLAYQGDPAEQVYIIKEGKLATYKTDSRGLVQSRQVYEKGDVIRESWLLEHGVHDAILRGEVTGKVYVLTTYDVQDFLDRFPRALVIEGAARTSSSAEQQKTTDESYQRYGVLAGEVIEYESRRTKWILVSELALLVLGGVLLLGVMIGVDVLFELGFSPGLGIATFALLTPFILIGLYRYIDWYYDYLLMTNRHLAHREFDLRVFSNRIMTFPLEQVQSVRIDKNGIINRLFKIGTIEVTTAAQRRLIFDRVREPDEFRRRFEAVRRREQQFQSSHSIADVRAFLREAFAVPKSLKPVADEDEQTGYTPLEKERRRRREKRKRLNDADHTIHYRKHLIVLFLHTWWDILLIFVTTIGMAVAWLLSLPLNLILLVGGSLLVGELAYFIYFYLDFRDEDFMVKGDLVIDIDRKPFLKREVRKTANLADVQDVSVSQPSIFSNLFKYGNVKIKTAGASADIEFENVVNPILVQIDIFERRQQVLRARRVNETAQRNRELGLILREFRQLQDNEKFPDYTLPTPEEEEDYMENF